MSTNHEEIIRVQVLDTNELQLVLASGGNANYQYVYREAKGVYWDNDVGAFRGTERTKWTFTEWFTHIVEVCADIGVSLSLGSTVEWVGVSEADKLDILGLQTA